MRLRSFIALASMILCPGLNAVDMPAIALAVSVLSSGVQERALKSDSESKPSSLDLFLRKYLNDPLNGEDKTTRVSIALVPLKGDGTVQAIVYVTGREWCGSGGCITLILDRTGSTYRVVSEITITRLPIRVLSTKSHGWRDISVLVQGGGITHAYDSKLSFDGKTYPTNPTVPPAKRLGAIGKNKTAIPVNDTGTLLYP